MTKIKWLPGDSVVTLGQIRHLHKSLSQQPNIGVHCINVTKNAIGRLFWAKPTAKAIFDASVSLIKEIASSAMMAAFRRPLAV